MSVSPYDRDLDRNPANFQPLTPLSLLERAAAVFPDRPAIAHGPSAPKLPRVPCAIEGSPRRSPGEASPAATPSRSCSPTRRPCSSATTACPCAAPCSTPSTSASTPSSLAFMLDHGEAKAIIVDREFSSVVAAALKRAKVGPLVIDYDDPEYDGPGERLGGVDYEAFSPKATKSTSARLPATNGMRSRSTTPRARPAIRRASSTIIAAPICSRSAISSPPTWGVIRSTCGRCRCSIATAGAFPGRSA